MLRRGLRALSARLGDVGLDALNLRPKAGLTKIESSHSRTTSAAFHRDIRRFAIYRGCNRALIECNVNVFSCGGESIAWVEKAVYTCTKRPWLQGHLAEAGFQPHLAPLELRLCQPQR